MTQENQTTLPKVGPLKTTPSGFSPNDMEMHLLIAHDLACAACNHHVLSKRVLQALFEAAVVRYFSVMRQKQWRRLEERLMAVLSPDGSKHPEYVGVQVFIAEHDCAPSDLIETYAFFKTIRDKAMAHKDPNWAEFVPNGTTQDGERWVRYSQMPKTLCAHPLYGKGNGGYLKLGGVPEFPDTIVRAFKDLVSVTLQVLWHNVGMSCDS